ncbi:MAG: bifunctional riboflavin kinase/FAD synthetase [Oscillospiraceae bacterium]|nr:bifunctional riboflavin kinase/FAD synthetase [Oscillospiraceae bacterium]
MKKYIYALGFFDGVHLGHQELLRRCRSLATEYGCESAAITFDRHPKSLFLQNPPVLISTIPDRELLLKRYGMSFVRVLPVNAQTMSQPWEKFLEMLMAEGAAGFVCGDDFRFGHRGEGNPEKLRAFCAGRGLPCCIVPEQTVSDIRVSSTYIRRQIESGDMATAVRFLGHPYTLTGTVVRGQQLGRRLGIPTANLRLPEGLAVPRFGVYACRILIDGVCYPAVTNIGTRPTVSGEGITVEPWILDYSGDLYGREITLEFCYFLRPEQKFPSLEALQAEIRRNAAQTREYLAEDPQKV